MPGERGSLEEVYSQLEEVYSSLRGIYSRLRAGGPKKALEHELARMKSLLEAQQEPREAYDDLELAEDGEPIMFPDYEDDDDDE